MKLFFTQSESETPLRVPLKTLLYGDVFCCIDSDDTPYILTTMSRPEPTFIDGAKEFPPIMEKLAVSLRSGYGIWLVETLEVEPKNDNDAVLVINRNVKPFT